MKGHRRALAQTGQGANGLQEWAGKASLVAQMVKHPPAMQELEGLMLKLKLQYFGHLMRRADSFEKTMMLGKIEDRRRRG